jgi:hypothetical protein
MVFLTSALAISWDCLITSSSIALRSRSALSTGSGSSFLPGDKDPSPGTPVQFAGLCGNACLLLALPLGLRSVVPLVDPTLRQELFAGDPGLRLVLLLVFFCFASSCFELPIIPPFAATAPR